MVPTGQPQERMMILRGQGDADRAVVRP